MAKSFYRRPWAYGTVVDVYNKKVFYPNGQNQPGIHGVNLTFDNGDEASFYSKDITLTAQFSPGDYMHYQIENETRYNKENEPYVLKKLKAFNIHLPLIIEKQKGLIDFHTKAILHAAANACDLVKLKIAENQDLFEEETIFKDTASYMLAWMVNAYQTEQFDRLYECPLGDIDEEANEIHKSTFEKKD